MTVFSKEGKPPGWLEKLQQEPGGRQLIYDLSAKHRGCLMLNYAIQKILYAGRESLRNLYHLYGRRWCSGTHMISHSVLHMLVP